MPKTEDDECAFLTAQYEGRASGVSAILERVETKIATYKERLGGMSEAATQPLPGMSLRKTPQENAIAQIACLTALRERILKESAAVLIED